MMIMILSVGLLYLGTAVLIVTAVCQSAKRSDQAMEEAIRNARMDGGCSRRALPRLTTLNPQLLEAR